MKIRSLLLVLGSVWLSSACGARTSDEEFLGYGDGDGPDTGGSGGRSGGGGTGGRGDTGGNGPLGGSGGIGGSGGGGGAGGIGGSGGATGGSGGEPSNSCCEAQADAGCNVPFVEECTCNLDPYCCETRWDERCVQVANRACFSGCDIIGSGGNPGVGGSSSAGGAGNNPGNCCDVHSAPGCQNTDVSACVCSIDPFCCESQWDNYCVMEAENYCGAECWANGTGGAIGAGGSALSCDFTGECGSCLCESCASQVYDCRNDLGLGCFAIAWCLQASDCLSNNCDVGGTCKELIDAFGGPNSPSAQQALALTACGVNSGCDCQ